MQTDRRLEITLFLFSTVFFGIVYLWFISVGTWTHLSQTSTYYYRMQADGFLAGTPALLQQPDPRLAQLGNPYIREARQGIPIIMDASYYNGKYYLYYGPVPAIILAGFMFFFHHSVSDGYFTFIGGLITIIFSSLVVLKIWRNHFKYLPVWLLILSLAVSGFSLPILWVMNTARIYEAAVSMGMAFVIAGLFFVMDTLEGERSRIGNLLLASFFWGMAFGTRLILGVAVAILCGAVILRILSSDGKIRLYQKSIFTVIIFLIPISVILILLGWYNFIRFNNPFEPGLRYALTGISGSDFSTTLGVFDLRYFPANLYNYLLNPFGLISKYPFLVSKKADSFIYTAIYHTSLGYNSEYVTGLFLMSPLTIFIGFFIRYVVPRQSKLKDRQGINSVSKKIFRINDLAITLGAIGLASMMSLICLLFYPVVSNRFFMDFIPLLNIVTISSIWLVYEKYKNSKRQRIIISLLFSFLAVYSVLVSFLLAFFGELNRFHI